AKHNGKSIVQEVCILFDNILFRGNRSFKYNSAKFEAFRSPNYPVLVEAGIHVKYNFEALMNNSDKKFICHNQVDNKVAVLKLFPAISASTIKSILDADVRSIVMETFGSGNTTTEKWFLDLLSDAIKSGKNILNISQCSVGSAELGRFE